MSNYSSILEEVKSMNCNCVLVAVSKTKSIDEIMAAYNEGARVFGENRVQEIEEKFTFRPKDMSLFLIGRLQKNKVKKAVKLVDRIESVDSISLLEKINSEAEKIDKRMDILFEVNSSGEENKGGFRNKEELFSAVLYAQKLKNVRLLGLMTVGPIGSDIEKNIKAFKYTKSLYDEINKTYHLSVLSMGMSGDWKEAIEEGSTEVRIGRAIFGERA